MQLKDFVADTGAVRSADVDHLDFASMPLIGLLGVIAVAGKGGIKYGRHNYNKGFPVHVTLNHVAIHFIKYLLGDRSEDHLSKVAWGAMVANQTAVMNPEMHDPYMLGPGAALTAALVDDMDNGKPERDAKRQAGEFESLFDGTLADMPEVKEILAQRESGKPREETVKTAWGEMTVSDDGGATDQDDAAAEFSEFLDLGSISDSVENASPAEPVKPRETAGERVNKLIREYIKKHEHGIIGCVTKPVVQRLCSCTDITEVQLAARGVASRIDERQGLRCTHSRRQRQRNRSSGCRRDMDGVRRRNTRLLPQEPRIGTHPMNRPRSPDARTRPRPIKDTTMTIAQEPVPAPYGAVNYDPWGKPRVGDWIQTYTGKRFYLLDPKQEDFDIRDIACSLSNICRFTGHTSTTHWFWGKRSAFYSVAQHACLVYDAVLDMGRGDAAYAALMHDNTEAFICDMARPFKQLPEFSFYREIEKRLEWHLCQAFQVKYPYDPIVKTADEILLGTEARDLMRPCVDGWHFRYEHLKKKIRPWSPRKSEREFMKRYYKCNPFGVKKPSFWLFSTGEAA